MASADTDHHLLLELNVRLHDWLVINGLEAEHSLGLTSAISFTLTIAFALAVNMILQVIFRSVIGFIMHRIKTKSRAYVWEAALRRNTFSKSNANIVAALIVYYLIPYSLIPYPTAVSYIQNLLEGYLVIVVTIAITSYLKASVEVYRHDGWSQRLPLQFLSQAAQTVIWLVSSILVISVVFDKSVSTLLTGLAGMTALLMLIFRDTLLGWVAGIQIVEDDLIREGDWVVFPKYQTDGSVIDIGLVTIKVQNWDKSVSTIPSYSFIQDGFTNWRGMYNSKGRRFKRVIPIDMRGVKFCDEDLLNRLLGIDLLREQIETHLKALNNAGSEEAAGIPEDMSQAPTNLGLYRAYLEEYLRDLPAINNDMTMMVRPTKGDPEGLMFEIYGFTHEQNWAKHESIAADIVNHALATLPIFDLVPSQRAPVTVHNAPVNQ